MLRTNSTHGPIQPIKVVRIFPVLHIYKPCATYFETENALSRYTNYTKELDWLEIMEGYQCHNCKCYYQHAI